MLESHDLRISQNEKIADNLYLMSVLAPETALSASPGQFVHVRIPGNRSLVLRRPISISYADDRNGMIELVYQIAGKGTRILAAMKQGDTINLLGPLGRGFVITGAEQNVFLVGGGCGVAPLRFIAKKWPDLKLYSFLGFRSLSAAYLYEEFSEFSKETHVATEDGSLGSMGYITELVHNALKDRKPDLILSCGPVPMLKKIQELAGQYGVPCQLSLEEKMGCGIGGCLVCSCSIAGENGLQYKRVCADGPVFRSEEVVWNE
jgi:dihydroorotate dehydrogenase electron transfer subunit